MMESGLLINTKVVDMDVKNPTKLELLELDIPTKIYVFFCVTL